MRSAVRSIGVSSAESFAVGRQSSRHAVRLSLTAAPTTAAMAGFQVESVPSDAEGNMVSLIQSNYRGMGSGMTPPGLGFVLQDRGELFSLEEGHPNAFEPGKRPFHTIIPAFISKGGKPLISFGLMGGGMQPQGHAQIVMNLVDFGMDLQEAGDAARFHHTGSSSFCP